ncbi:MAG: patatin-like phospholipase family protein [Prolixibacteraceae bacterium]|nr:patatin-like phospholipase family protein [Prolixibacteraceae bacterium]
MHENPRPYKFGISLSGGGARGIVHIGVLEALHKYGIRPEIISGASAGALVGVFYAAGMEPLQILELVKANKMVKMFKWQMPSNGLIDIKKVVSLLEMNIEKDDFASLKKPFYCSVVNLNSGHSEIKHEGKLFQWVLASASIPIIFEPQVIDGNSYVDGGLLNNLPVDCIRNQCRILIGVHVNHNGAQENISGIKAVAERTFRLAMSQNVRESLTKCDFVIDPPETRKFNTFDFKKADELFRIGFEETEKRILEMFDSIDLSQIIQETSRKAIKDI